MRLTPDKVKQIPKLVESMTTDQIGVELGCSGRAVRAWIYKLRRAGVRVPTKLGPRPMKLK